MPQRIKKIIARSPKSNYFKKLEHEPVNRLVHWLDKDFVRNNYEQYGLLGLTAIDYLYQGEDIKKNEIFVHSCYNFKSHRKTSLDMKDELILSSQDNLTAVLIYNNFKKCKKYLSLVEDIYDLKALCFLEYFYPLIKPKFKNNIENMAFRCSDKFSKNHPKLLRKNIKKYDKVLKKYQKKNYYYNTLDKLSKLKKNSLILSDTNTYNDLEKFEKFLKVDLEKEKFKIWTNIFFKKLTYLVASCYCATSFTINISLDRDKMNNLELLLSEPINTFYNLSSFFSDHPELITYGSTFFLMAYLKYQLFSKNF